MMEELLVFLVVVVIPALILSGVILGIVALLKQRSLRLRIDDLERSVGAGSDHPLARRLGDLERRIGGLETAGLPEATAPTPPAGARPRPADATAPPRTTGTAHVPPLHEPEAAQPPTGPPAATPSLPEPPITEPEPGPGPVPTRPTASPPPPSSPAVEPRATIDWERWIGVRGAAAAGGIVLALASLLFFQYSIEHGLISPTMRVVLGVIAGIVCLVGSEWLVKRDQPAAGNALAGAGVVILYGATWAAQNLYGLIGTVPAFALMVLITAVCVALAVARRALFIAVLGLVGGFATPVLVASEMDSPAALFGYILLLDLGLLWLARARAWPVLAVLSLAGTAVHQAIWIFASMDAEQSLTGIAVLGVFGLAFLLVSGGDRESSTLWRATRAGGVAIPFAFALHFAATAELADNPWPLGALLLTLSAGAIWLERRGGHSGAAVAAAAADIAVMGLWFLGHRMPPSLAWLVLGLCVAMAALFTAAAELWRDRERSRGLDLAALVSALGFSALSILAVPRCDGFELWPWTAAWIALGGLLVLGSRRPGRVWVQLAAGIVPAIGLAVAVGEHGRDAGAPEGWVWIGLMIGFAVAFQALALLTSDGTRRLWAERAAATTALSMMVGVASLPSIYRADNIAHLGAVLVLGVLAALAATRMRSGVWLLASTVAAAFLQAVVCFGGWPNEALGPALVALALSATFFTVWPALVPTAFRSGRAGWWGAALAGPLWFFPLWAVWHDHFGNEGIGLLPVGLAAVALATALRTRTRLSTSDAGRRTMIVWYLAVALSLVSVAIPLQLDNEWITIGWAVNGLAILALWVRLDHPGLKYFGLALLGAATVRLVANPWVLSYHVRSGASVLNWLTYTYLVPAAAMISSHLLLRRREIDRLTRWERRIYPVEKPIWASCCGLAAVAVVFAWINLAIADAFATGPNLELSFERMPARDAATSVAWAVYALVLLAIGVRSKSGSLRWLSLGMLVLTLGKVFLHDLGRLEDLYRVASLVGLALSLIIVSLIYQRFVFRTNPDPG